MFRATFIFGFNFSFLEMQAGRGFARRALGLSRAWSRLPQKKEILFTLGCEISHAKLMNFS